MVRPTGRTGQPEARGPRHATCVEAVAGVSQMTAISGGLWHSWSTRSAHDHVRRPRNSGEAMAEHHGIRPIAFGILAARLQPSEEPPQWVLIRFELRNPAPDSQRKLLSKCLIRKGAPRVRVGPNL